MSNKRYILICSQRGVFLGCDSHYAYFSRYNPLEAWRAASFSSAEAALEFCKETLTQMPGCTFSVGEVETKDKYVSVVDMIRAGYADAVGDMFMHLPTGRPGVH